jgi:NAD(P)-dependent dehydrogenase (short-subunit alcohol dehydrogenase family)
VAIGGFARDANSAMTLTGKVALVAGGTGGLGQRVSLAFLNDGAKVIVTYVSAAEFDDLKITLAA